MPVELRQSAQGLSHFAMGIAGASAGALSGLVFERLNYPSLALLAAVAALPLVALLVRSSEVGGRAASMSPRR